MDPASIALKLVKTGLLSMVAATLMFFVAAAVYTYDTSSWAERLFKFLCGTTAACFVAAVLLSIWGS